MPLSDNNLISFLFLMAATAGIVGLFVALSKWLGPREPNPSKQAPFECGWILEPAATRPYPIRYYLVAILFIVFDIEIAFLYPWAVGFRGFGMVGFVSMMIFLAVLLVGLYYAVKKHVFDWK
jgi:NADH-quinone oxidoreductase subunit A